VRGGSIERIFSGKEFFSLPAQEISALHLRSFSAAAPFSGVCEKAGSGNNLIIKNFQIRRQKNYGGKVPLRLDIRELSLKTGTAVAVIGSNGAGKTTFARCLCGLEKKDRGVLILDGKIISRKERLKRCYMVMQDVN
jgi:energy-coupling factor transport system ATP-binding protein